MSTLELKEKISAWLLKQGYPLEMRVAEACVKAGFKVRQSDYYADPQFDKPREIDVSASVQRIFRDILVRLALSVECKADNSKPWVIFASDRIRLHQRARVAQRSATLFGHIWLEHVSERADVQNLEIFRLSSPPAYGVAAAFSDGADIPYTALMAAATAANAKTKAEDTQSGEWICSIHFPVVVTEAPLFLCTLGNNSEPVLKDIERATLVWRNPVYRMPHCIIDVVHASSIDAFTKDAIASFEFLLTQTEQELVRSMRELKIVRKTRKSSPSRNTHRPSRKK
jgi:hypothetical protein